MPQFERTARIHADPARVARLVLDVDRWAEWLPTVTAVRRADAGPLAVGSSAQVSQPRLPKATWTVTEIRPGESFTWESRRAGVCTIGRHEVEPTSDGGSLVRLSIEQTGLLAAVAWLLTRRLTTSYVEQEAAAVKATCEQ